ncbi:hypothetical protein OIDMADRAFT_16571 [Oidiodendron maius Zn]|uniref:Phosphatidylglycerol/phosphatidylinositol transfer protein n=1 Tax=Oidiodendron maius (strain Zn) TaxID=913774 RepID=A0A0C3HJ67_OIDMZ|nr:hypothetical protein OIDMADRAFT_16571 [Oidiodendron maius Zn]
MKVSTSLLALFLSSLVAAEGLSFNPFSGQKPLAGERATVPGDSPLTYCQGEHDDDLLVIEYINLDPNPPAKGQNLTIEAVGTFLEDVDNGAYVILQVKYGLIKLVNTETSLCEQVSNVNLECPIKKGKKTITKEVALPREIPPGTYTVSADAYTARPESKKLTCLEATVTFT